MDVNNMPRFRLLVVCNLTSDFSNYWIFRIHLFSLEVRKIGIQLYIYEKKRTLVIRQKSVMTS